MTWVAVLLALYAAIMATLALVRVTLFCDEWEARQRRADLIDGNTPRGWWES